MRAALDTNLLVYAEGFGDPARVSATRRLLEQLSDADVVIPLQCLGELFRVLTGKAGRSAAQVQDVVLNWMDAFPVLETNAAAWCSIWLPRLELICCSPVISTPAFLCLLSGEALKPRLLLKRARLGPATP